MLNPGSSTTTDTVKMAQVVPDICPREKEFLGMMKQLRSDLLKIVHADESKYTSVLFCGSGTINIDVCLNSLLPDGKKFLSKEYPTRSYYCNLYLQYDFFERTGEMHFTPPVQTIFWSISKSVGGV